MTITATLTQPYSTFTAVSVKFPRAPFTGRPTAPLRIRVRKMAEELGYSEALIRCQQRSPQLVNARYRIAKQFRSEGHTLAEIGRAINRGHSNIISLLKRGIVE